MEIEQVLDLIKSKNLIKRGETIGVAVSGGADSMSLLHFLNTNKDALDCEVVAITIDHMDRENSILDCDFVLKYCKENGIRCHKFAVDTLKLAEAKKIGAEHAAREGRYGIFETLISKGVIDKIALAHHKGDQAETVLLNMLRGSGIAGAGGMEYIRDGKFIRPFLDVSKDDIVRYAHSNDIPYVEDETNAESMYNRNYLRNIIIPLIKKRFPNFEQNMLGFAVSCKEDDAYIKKQVNMGAVIFEGNTVKIPLNYFVYDNSLTSRMLMECLKSINSIYDIERKHINMLRELATLEVGKKIDLPHDTKAIKEYEYMVITKKERNAVTQVEPLKSGSFIFANAYKITVKKTDNFEVGDGSLVLDANKVPKTAVWRAKSAGDKIEKFGGGTKTLKAFLVDKKVPARVRETLPVLADKNTVYCVPTVDISSSVKVDKTTKTAYVVSCKQMGQTKTKK